MVLLRSSEAFRRLSLCLSLLALCSALMAPVSALAQEAKSGAWSGLCSVSANAQPEGHDRADEGHCGLCMPPGFALPGVDCRLALPPAAEPGPAGSPPAATGVRQAAPPAIRGPPVLL